MSGEGCVKDRCRGGVGGKWEREVRYAVIFAFCFVSGIVCHLCLDSLSRDRLVEWCFVL